jgi:O2-independent ubiquinone biosynthesis accessory factor UbiT
MKTGQSITTKVVQWAPAFARASLFPLPKIFQSCGLEWAFNQTLKESLCGDELSFLHGRTVSVQVQDIGLSFSVTMTEQQLAVKVKLGAGDVTIKGKMMDFLVLMAGKVDPDTLFFSRRLSLTGDTELGLHVKNFLDTLDIESILPRPLVGALEKLPATP